MESALYNIDEVVFVGARLNIFGKVCVFLSLKDKKCNNLKNIKTCLSSLIPVAIKKLFFICLPPKAIIYYLPFFLLTDVLCVTAYS